MHYWVTEDHWPSFIPPGYSFFPVAFEAVGKKILGEEWSSRVLEPARPKRANPSDDQADVDDARRSVMEAIHRLAAAGALVLTTADDRGEMIPIRRSYWNRPPAEAYSIFERCTVRADAEMARMAGAPPSLQLFMHHSPSEHPIFIENTSIVQSLRGISVEPLAEGKSVTRRSVAVEDFLRAASPDMEIALKAAGPTQITGTDRPNGPARRGRPPKWKWDQAVAELIRIADEDGLESIGPGQSDLERWMTNWFAARHAGESPAESQIREKIAPIFEARRQANIKRAEK